MPQRFLMFLAAIAALSSVHAVPFYWEPKADEPGFTIDVPQEWIQASRARDKVANVHFEHRDRGGRVAIEVRAYNSENTDLEYLVLQLRSRLAVKYDRVFLLKRRELIFRKNVEHQVWSAQLGKKNYTLITTFVVAEDRVLQLICVAPTATRKQYKYIFDNALLSLDFSDGKPEETGNTNAAAPETAPAVAPASPAPPTPAPASPASPAAPANSASAPPPAPAAPAKSKPPKIDF